MNRHLMGSKRQVKSLILMKAIWDMLEISIDLLKYTNILTLLRFGEIYAFSRIHQEISSRELFSSSVSYFSSGAQSNKAAKE